MIKRGFLLIVFVISFLVFYNLIPFSIYSKYPIILSLLFSIITVILLYLTVFNIGSLKDLKFFNERTEHLKIFRTTSYVFSIFAFIGFFFLYFFNYTSAANDEFINNSVKTTGVIIDKWTETQTRRFQNNSFTHIKVRYKADDKYIVSEHITNQGFMIDIPEVGQTITVFYSRANPAKFETEWERNLREYDPLTNPENIRRKHFLDSVLKAKETLND